MRLLLRQSYAMVRRGAIVLIGLTTVVVGVALIFLPGPAIIVIPLGLTILGTEFAWARGLLYRLEQWVMRMRRLKR